MEKWFNVEISNHLDAESLAWDLTIGKTLFTVNWHGMRGASFQVFASQKTIDAIRGYYCH